MWIFKEYFIPKLTIVHYELILILDLWTPKLHVCLTYMFSPREGSCVTVLRMLCLCSLTTCFPLISYTNQDPFSFLQIFLLTLCDFHIIHSKPCHFSVLPYLHSTLVTSPPTQKKTQKIKIKKKVSLWKLRSVMVCHAEYSLSRQLYL